MEIIGSGLEEMLISICRESRSRRKKGIVGYSEPKSNEELEKMLKEAEEQYCRDHGIPLEKPAPPPTEEQEIEDYRKSWERCYGPRFGSFDAETSVGPLHCLDEPMPDSARPERSLQFFSIKVTDLRYDLSWPLQVYGFVAARDAVDRKRNYLFRCTRGSCQTLTRKDPFLRLTGPSRAVLLIDQVAVEVQLKVKGNKEESEDKVLAFKCFDLYGNYLLKDCIPSQRCELDFALAALPKSVQAVVDVRVVGGSWPDQCTGVIVCRTTEDVKEGEGVLLLDFQDGKLPTKSDGAVELSRRIVSVDFPAGNVIFSVEASRNRLSAKGKVKFGVNMRGSSTRTCDLVFCKMEVTVSWSLFSARGPAAEMEISVRGEPSSKTRSKKTMKGTIENSKPNSLTHTRTQKRHTRPHQIQKTGQQFRRDPRLPEIHRGEVEDTAPLTKKQEVEETASLTKEQEVEETASLTEEQEVECYRKYWEKCFSRRYGSYEAETSLGPMYCSTGTIPSDALPESSLQFFSIKVTDLKYGLRWPLQVHGFVAARDSVDRKRNYLFRCSRDSCQTLNEDDPFLRLTGPSRAVLMIDPVSIEVQLKVKTKEGTEDEVLAFECFDFHERYPLKDGIHACIPRKRCTLEFAVALLGMSVEASVGVRVIDGSWPAQCPGLIVCNTDKVKDERGAPLGFQVGKLPTKSDGVKEGRMVLLDFRDGKLPTKSGDGEVELSRRIVSVNYPAGKLVVSVEASRDGFYARDTVDFGMKLLGASSATCDLVFCRMEVTVSWSLVSMYREK